MSPKKLTKIVKSRSSDMVDTPDNEGIDNNLQIDDDYSSDENDNDGDKGNEGDDDNDDYDEDEYSANDGLADMMNKILNQKVSKNPVLAKRKTSLMKEVEELHIQKEANKESRIERKRKREKFLMLPNPLTADFEKQLRKVATKGTRGVWLCVHGNGCEQILTILFTGSGDTQEEKGVLAERLRCRLEVPVSLS